MPVDFHDLTFLELRGTLDARVWVDVTESRGGGRAFLIWVSGFF